MTASSGDSGAEATAPTTSESDGCPAENPFTGTFSQTWSPVDRLQEDAVETRTFILTQDGLSITETFEWSIDYLQCCVVTQILWVRATVIDERSATFVTQNSSSDQCTGPGGCVGTIGFGGGVTPYNNQIGVLEDSCNGLRIGDEGGYVRQ